MDQALKIIGAGLAGAVIYQLIANKAKHHKHENYDPVVALLGDVGGTNIRFQLVVVQPPANEPKEIIKK
jgi:hypothetical protein